MWQIALAQTEFRRQVGLQESGIGTLLDGSNQRSIDGLLVGFALVGDSVVLKNN
jgi:hypothetical protein